MGAHMQKSSILFQTTAALSEHHFLRQRPERLFMNAFSVALTEHINSIKIRVTDAAGFVAPILRYSGVRGSSAYLQRVRTMGRLA